MTTPTTPETPINYPDHESPNIDYDTEEEWPVNVRRHLAPIFEQMEEEAQLEAVRNTAMFDEGYASEEYWLPNIYE